MRQLTSSVIRELLHEQKPPCISLYQATHRYPANAQDPIRYKNSLRALEESLRAKYPLRETREILMPLAALVDDHHFWTHQLDGLAILRSGERFELFQLQRPTPDLAIVADGFHIKPLLRIAQSADRYQVLCLSRQVVQLYEGNRDALDEVELTNVPATLTEALGAELTEPHLTVASYGKGSGGHLSGRGEPAMVHGHGSKKDEIDIDVERFFRVVDRAVYEHHSRPSGLPLMLAALPEYHPVFHAVSKNPHLLSEGIELNPDSLRIDELRERAWQKLEPHYLQRLGTIIERYEIAKSRGRGSDDIQQVAKAAVDGRVGTLLVEAERKVPGTIDRGSGIVNQHQGAAPHTEDLLDDLAELTLSTDGEVIIVPSQRMPTTTGLAAIYRF